MLHNSSFNIGEVQMIKGVYVANVTPFRAEGTIDTDAYVAHVAWLAKQGVQGVVPFGTNGEGPSVTLQEKLQVLDALFARALPLQIIPAVMQGNLQDSLEFVSAINEYPATAVLILPPYFFKPVDADGLRRFFEPLIERSRHPVLLYHVPKYGVPVPTELVRDLEVWGVKDSEGEAGYAETILEAGKGVLIGTEDDTWRRLQGGAQGLISALANFIPEHLVEIYRLVQAGDEEAGQALAARLLEVRKMTKAYAAPALLKRLAQARHGTPMGTVRPPLVPAPDDYDIAPILERAEVAASDA
jgi:4-hydroxy-tetrahydrodipicolinate synthase